LDSTDVTLRIVGAFYAFAGTVATRAAISSRFLDRALAEMSTRKPPLSETAQSIWLIAASLIVLAGGAALMLKLDFAVWVFLLSAGLQALYIFLVAPLWFDVEDPPDPGGRQRTTSAFIIYLGATAFVVWAFANSRLLRVDQIPEPALLGTGTALLAYVGYVLWLLRR
jgi:hypothetical protein